MVRRKDLQEGLMWIAGKLKLTIELYDNNLEVHLNPNYPNEQQNISLYITIISQREVIINDLVGNSDESGYADRGFGTLLVNTGISVLKIILKNHNHVLVRGKVYGGADLPFDSISERRNHFWTRFNFHLRDPKAVNTRMKQYLGDLKLVKGSLFGSNIKKIINIEDFWSITKPYFMTSFDIEKVLSFSVTHIERNKAPSKKYLKHLREKGFKESTLIENMVFLSTWLLVIWLAFFYTSIPTFIGIVIVSGFLSKLLGIVVRQKYSQYLPSKKKYFELSEFKGRVTQELVEYVKNFERSYNGVLWRLQHDCVSSLRSESSELFEASLNGHYHYLSKNYSRYIDILEKLKIQLS